MKKLSFLFILPTVLIGCTNSLEETVSWESVEQSTVSLTAKQNFVTLEAVATLTKAQMNMTRNASDVRKHITCYEDDTHDTLLYICDNTDGGWIMYPSDTRVPPIVAQCDSGTFAEAMTNESAALWVKAIAEDMKHIRSVGDHELNFSKEEIEHNANFWESVSSPDKYVKEHIAHTRGGNGVAIPQGHYELISTTYSTEVYDSIARLTTTNWTQEYPYNKYCPYLINSTTNHSPAGCVAIAGAQMLFFLHYKLGVPQTAPSEAYCNGDYTNYEWAQTNYTTEIWDKMNIDNKYAAPLIADVGRRVGMNYGESGSVAYTSDLVAKVFKPYGIDCTYSSYDTEKLKTNLLGGMPVILRAEDEGGAGGHAFIADRYKRNRTVIKHIYEWVYDSYPTNPDGSFIPVPAPTRKTEISYTSPTISMIGMNWGWGNVYNGEWYSLTEDWTLSTYKFNVSRKMIHNFEIIEN